MDQGYKIEIAIVRCQTTSTSSGFETVYSTDKALETSIIDTGLVFHYIDASASIIRLISLREKGWFIVSMKPTIGRDGEYRASWVYIPFGVNISGSEIKELLNEIESEIKNEPDEEKMKFIASKPYYGPISVPSINLPEQESYAIRFFGGEYLSLEDILENIIQREHCKYKWVILLQQEDKNLVHGNITDITNTKFSPSTVINPPVDDKNGFDVYVNTKRFSEPIRLLYGDSIHVTWKRKGYADIRKEVHNQTDLHLSKSDIHRLFSINEISIVDKKTKRAFVPGGEARIEVNNVLVQKNGYIEIPIDKWNQVKINIFVPGYKKVCIDLSKIQVGGSLPVCELTPEVHRYTFSIPIDPECGVRDVRYAEFSIESQYKMTESPIKGYRCLGNIQENKPNDLRQEAKFSVQSQDPYNKNRMNQKGIRFHDPTPPDISDKKSQIKSKKWGKNKLFLIGIGGLIALLLILASIYKSCSTDKNLNYKKGDVENERIDGSKTDTSWNSALEMLKGCDNVWEEDKFVIYKDLRDVYNMINNFKFNEITDFYSVHEDELKKIKGWEQLYKYSLEKKQGKGQYSTNGKITISKYLDKVSKFEDKYPSDNGKKAENSGNGMSTPQTQKGTSTGQTPTPQRGDNEQDNSVTNGDYE